MIGYILGAVITFGLLAWAAFSDKDDNPAAHWAAVTICAVLWPLAWAAVIIGYFQYKEGGE